MPASMAGQGGGASCHYSPRVTRVLVGKGQDICSSASALVDHYWHSWAGPHVLPHHQDHTGASFQHQPDHGNTLAHSCFKTHLTSYKHISVTHTTVKTLEKKYMEKKSFLHYLSFHLHLLRLSENFFNLIKKDHEKLLKKLKPSGRKNILLISLFPL